LLIHPTEAHNSQMGYNNGSGRCESWSRLQEHRVWEALMRTRLAVLPQDGLHYARKKETAGLARPGSPTMGRGTGGEGVAESTSRSIEAMSIIKLPPEKAPSDSTSPVAKPFCLIDLTKSDYATLQGSSHQLNTPSWIVAR
jgi:hypothetical protein